MNHKRKYAIVFYLRGFLAPDIPQNCDRDSSLHRRTYNRGRLVGS